MPLTGMRSINSSEALGINEGKLATVNGTSKPEKLDAAGITAIQTLEPLLKLEPKSLIEQGF